MENGYRWDEEFQEEDMWGVAVKEREDSDSDTDSDCGRRRNTKRRNRAKSSKNVQESRMSSAPVNIPDWSKIYGTNPKKWEVDSSWDGDGDSVNVMMPPHQLIARKQLSSFSVFEGAGRTLKGRDLSRVRNAVLTKTGFLESKSHHC